MQVQHTSTSKGAKARLAAAAAAALLAVSMAFLTACSQPQPASTEEKPVTASDYMVSMAQSSKSLSESLSEFAGAVSESDVSAIRAKADSAYDVLKQMESLEAPDELKDVKDKYNEATQTLKGALDEYLALFMAIESVPEGEPFDYSTYDESVESVQKAYDQGLNLLEEADKMAAEM